MCRFKEDLVGRTLLSQRTFKDSPIVKTASKTSVQKCLSHLYHGAGGKRSISNSQSLFTIWAGLRKEIKQVQMLVVVMMETWTWWLLLYQGSCFLFQTLNDYSSLAHFINSLLLLSRVFFHVKSPSLKHSFLFMGLSNCEKVPPAIKMHHQLRPNEYKRYKTRFTILFHFIFMFCNEWLISANEGKIAACLASR